MDDENLNPEEVPETNPDLLAMMNELGQNAQMAEAGAALFQMYRGLLVGGFSALDASMIIASYLLVMTTNGEGNQ